MICNIKRRPAGGVKVGTLDVGSIIQIAVDGVMKNFIVVNQGVPGNNSRYGTGSAMAGSLQKTVGGQAGVGQVWQACAQHLCSTRKPLSQKEAITYIRLHRRIP